MIQNKGSIIELCSDNEKNTIIELYDSNTKLQKLVKQYNISVRDLIYNNSYKELIREYGTLILLTRKLINGIIVGKITKQEADDQLSKYLSAYDILIELNSEEMEYEFEKNFPHALDVNNKSLNLYFIKGHNNKKLFSKSPTTFARKIYQVLSKADQSFIESFSDRHPLDFSSPMSIHDIQFIIGFYFQKIGYKISYIEHKKSHIQDSQINAYLLSEKGIQDIESVFPGTMQRENMRVDIGKISSRREKKIGKYLAITIARQIFRSLDSEEQEYIIDNINAQRVDCHTPLNIHGLKFIIGYFFYKNGYEVYESIPSKAIQSKKIIKKTQKTPLPQVSQNSGSRITHHSNQMLHRVTPQGVKKKPSTVMPNFSPAKKTAITQKWV